MNYAGVIMWRQISIGCDQFWRSLGAAADDALGMRHLPPPGSSGAANASYDDPPPPRPSDNYRPRDEARFGGLLVLVATYVVGRAGMASGPGHLNAGAP